MHVGNATIDAALTQWLSARYTQFTATPLHSLPRLSLLHGRTGAPSLPQRHASHCYTAYRRELPRFPSDRSLATRASSIDTLGRPAGTAP